MVSASASTSRIHSSPNRGKPHLRPKPVNTRLKARQCGEVTHSVQGLN
ncbi:hypothetical protein HanXRQr2_Chr13g0566501 [Helianthus annuus]|uniref:Uncharacterized protein n=1 Tax=Helianthus annuus TaxID=4232 RepID=A0A9K3EDL4_HELAN|nr:hypothetical protein HanXRQr2_Chr13g0566501 [Helianthus annuus]KAJ0847453.1 hypothetical protein HanPSC8_Chr13g0545511 [Helianthus annuus]